jgi:hypothetical protein
MTMALEWIIQLAASGGAALAGAAATDAWRYARDGFAKALSRDDRSRAGQLERRLDATAGEIERTGDVDRERVRDAHRVAWQTRIEDVLEEHPEIATDLTELIREVQERLPRAEQRWVQHVVVSGPQARANVVQGGNIINYGRPTD